MTLSPTKPRALNVLTITSAIPLDQVERLKKMFKTVHYYPQKISTSRVFSDTEDGPPLEVLKETDVMLANWFGIPSYVTSLDQVPNLAHVQLQTSGADKALKKPLIANALANNIELPFRVSNVSGVHVLSIPHFIVSNTLNLYSNMHRQIAYAQNEGKWGSGAQFAHNPDADRSTWVNPTPYYVKTTIGKTVGFLGYGMLAREAARIFQTLQTNIIAANSSGKRISMADKYTIPGTGDQEATIPKELYSTTDRASFEEFLKKTDILVCSLPSTPQTHYMLGSKELSLLRPDAVLINVGRGDLIRSEDILEALDRKDGLLGVALDVTDPEPLPEGHPLFTHPKAIITPHLSGHSEGELRIGVDILIENVNRLREGKPPVNVVDWEKRY